MNPNYPLKTSNPLDVYTLFTSHIQILYPAHLSLLQPFFKKMNELRSKLDFAKYQKLVNGDFRINEEVHNFLLSYLAQCQVLEKYFKFGVPIYNKNNVNTSINLNCSWQDSFTSQMKNDNLMKTEIANCLYNLTICNINYAFALFPSQEPDEKKMALKSLRCALWAIREIKNFMGCFAVVFKDLQIENLNLMDNLLTGLSYLSIFEIYEKKENDLGLENMAAILMTSAKHFKLAASCLENAKSIFPKDLFPRLSLLLLFYESYSDGLSSLKMSRAHEDLITDEPKGQHMGFALGYITASSRKIMRILGNKEVMGGMSAVFQGKLKGLGDNVSKIAKNFEARNAQIYKERIFTENELGAPPELNTKFVVGPVIPEIFKTELPEEQLFRNLFQEDIKEENAMIKKILEEMKKNFDDLVINAINYKEQVYTANSIEMMTNIKSSKIGKKEVPETLLKAFNDYEAQGGSKNLKSAHKLLIEVCLMSGDVVKKIRGKLEDEKKENQLYLNKYKNLWNLPPSELLNQQFFGELNELLGKFNQAQKADEHFFKTFKDSKNFIDLFETGIEGILKLLPENEADSSKNQEIPILIQKKAAIDKIVSEMQADHKKFKETYSENIDKYVEEGKKKTVVFSQIAQIAFANFTPITNKTTDDLKTLSALLNQLLSDLSIRSSFPTSSVSSELFSSLSSLSFLLSQAKKALFFYEQLLNHLKALDNKVEVWVKGRKEAAQITSAQIEMLGGGKEEGGKREEGGGKKEEGLGRKEVGEKKEEIDKFYNEVLGEFAKGGSVFIPKNNLNQSTVISYLGDPKE